MKFLLNFFSLEWLRVFDFLAPLALRLWLAPMFWVDGVQRLGLFSSADFIWYNPMTWVNYEAVQANAAALTGSVMSGLGSETLTLLIGGIEVIGAVLLIFGFAVRWVVLALGFVVIVLGLLALGDASFVEAGKQLLMEHGFVGMLSNTTEVYLTYFIMLLALFFMGAGRWCSLDWFIYRHFARKIDARYDTHDPFEIDATDEPGIQPKVQGRA